MEYSERGRKVTEQVSMWIVNDGDHYFAARVYARDDRANGALNDDGLLAEYLNAVIRWAVRPSAPWQVAQELAPNDHGRIDWRSVADDLLAE